MTQSLGQILYHKQEIIESILDSLKKKHSLACASILELLTCFAKDLNEEIYSFFDQICSTLLSLATHPDPKVIEVSVMLISS